MRALTLALGTCLSLFWTMPTQASQPISISMAECSVIFDVLSITAEKRNKPQKNIDQMKRGAAIFKDAAYKQASSEGQAEPKAYIDNELTRLNKKWSDRWLNASQDQFIKAAEENLQWVQYCSKLGRERMLLPAQE